MMRKILLVSALSAAAFVGPARAEEEATGEVGHKSDAKIGMAGYSSVSDVVSQSRIDLDLKDIEDAGADWAAATSVYKNGKNSVKSSGALRTIASFSTGVEGSAMQQEHYYALGKKFWGRWDYADAHITAALSGADLEPFCKYASDPTASSDAARKQMVKKLAAYTAVRDYAVHEVESALVKYGDESLGEARFMPGGAAHAWDEWWAMYVGSLEDGGNEAGEKDGEGKGYGPYLLGEKRAPGFGTSGKIIGNGGASKVNWNLMFAAHAGQRLLQSPGNAEKLKGVAQCVRAVSIVPSIQGCLEYAYKASEPAVIEDADVPKYQAEAYAFCASALPFLAEADPTAAAKVHETVRVDSGQRPEWDVVKASFSAKNLNAMGVRCADVGALSVAYPDSGHTQCVDGELSNPKADASACDRIEMPSGAGSLRAGMGALVATLVATALMLV